MLDDYQQRKAAELLDYEGGKPSTVRLVSSYVRGFRPDREPIDRFDRAVALVYAEPDEQTQSVFGLAEGCKLTGRERSQTFNDIVYKAMKRLYLHFIKP